MKINNYVVRSIFYFSSPGYIRNKYSTNIKFICILHPSDNLKAKHRAAFGENRAAPSIDRRVSFTCQFLSLPTFRQQILLSTASFECKPITTTFFQQHRSVIIISFLFVVTTFLIKNHVFSCNSFHRYTSNDS
jgi:hypothetical protein